MKLKKILEIGNYFGSVVSKLPYTSVFMKPPSAKLNLERFDLTFQWAHLLLLFATMKRYLTNCLLRTCHHNEAIIPLPRPLLKQCQVGWSLSWVFCLESHTCALLCGQMPSKKHLPIQDLFILDYIVSCINTETSEVFYLHCIQLTRTCLLCKPEM